MGPGHVMLGEMFPNQIRWLRLAVRGQQWTANFLVSVSFPVLAKSLDCPSPWFLLHRLRIHFDWFP